MNRQQFEQMVEVEQESLRRFLLNLCHCRSTADDLAQDAFLKAYLNIGTFRSEAQARTWLFAIARNTFYDYVRKQSRHRTESMQNDVEATPPPSADEDAELYAAMQVLQQYEREAVLLFYMEEKSLKEIAVIMAMPVSTIKSHLRRARQHLKKFLSQ